jgi:L-asparaginase
MLPHVQLIFTGGTISMEVDRVVGAAIPVRSGEQILASVPGLDRYASFDINNFAKLPGPHMTPPLMLELAAMVRDLLARDDTAGAVVTHGTDTLEETAYFLDLVHESDKPVAFVGAMRNASELGWDGPPNLTAAVRTVVDPAARGLGVLVVMNDEINAAAETTKTHTEAVDTFRSPDFGPLGVVDKDRVILTRRPVARRSVPAPTRVPDVALVKMAAGTDGRMVRAAVSTGAEGLVVEALGRGNVPPEAVPAIREAIAAGLPVVVASRCLRGRVLDTYGYPGGGRELRELGCLLAGSLPGQKARILLMLALAASRSRDDLAGFFDGL